MPQTAAAIEDPDPKLTPGQHVPPGTYTPGQLAPVFRVTHRTIRNWAAAGRFPGAHRKQRGRLSCWLIPAEDANRITDQRRATLAAIAARAALFPSTAGESHTADPKTHHQEPPTTHP